MSLIEVHIDKNTKVFLWKITESIDYLIDKYNLVLSNDFFKIKSEIHKKQFIAKILLLNHLKLSNLIYKNDVGKPFLENGQHISISHSGKYVGIAIGNTALGLDIEKQNDKLIRIQNKFIDSKDFEYQDIITKNKLLWYWTAKEAVYKLIGKRGLSFKNDIRIKSFDFKNYEGIVYIEKYNKHIYISFKKIDKDYLMAISQC